MVPKFMMANGKLVRVLIHTDVTKYLEFKAVDGSYVLNKGRVCKVPATDMEALRSPLMGLFEKRRARNFFMCALRCARGFAFLRNRTVA
jgi:Rab GDP dissociation inhibitor